MPPAAPIDVPTRATADFVATHLPANARLLEIGCGAGEVAAALVRQGYRVTAIDSESDAVDAAAQRGVCAINATWPDFTCESVDAVLFTRSLHHISALDEAVTHCREVLGPDGLVVVEDFAFEMADPATLRWFVEVLRSRSARALIVPSSDELIAELATSSDPQSAWHLGHHHDLHPWHTMRTALARRFAIIDEHSVPYLYRYLVPALPARNDAVAFVEDTLDEELRCGESGLIRLIGRRVVARA